jgi:hypothetical protein
MTPRAKKGPRTLAGFRGGNGGEPNKETIHRAPTDGKPEPLLSGKDKQGRAVHVYPGDVARLVFQHDNWCPMVKGGTECRCKPDSYIEILSRAGGTR